MLTLLNWFGNLALALAFLSTVVATGAGMGSDKTLPATQLQPVDGMVEAAREPPLRRPGPSVRRYSPPRPRRVSVRSGSRYRSRSVGGGGFRFGK